MMRRRQPWAYGSGRSLEEHLHNIDEKYDEKIANTIREYHWKDKVSPEVFREMGLGYYLKLTIDEKTKERRIATLDEAIEILNNEREAEKRRAPYHFNRRTEFKDNAGYHNGGINNCRSNPQTIRVPSLKRNRHTWKRFYELFPYLKGEDTYNGIKLKKL